MALVVTLAVYTLQKGRQATEQFSTAITQDEQISRSLTWRDRVIAMDRMKEIEAIATENERRNEEERWEAFNATGYDLSVHSCGKSVDDPAYGYTANGTSLKGKSWAVRVIAVDPEVIPLGSKVLIRFPEGWSHMNGVYTAADTGTAIKGARIDIFFGETAEGPAIKFGRRTIMIKRL